MNKTHYTTPETWEMKMALEAGMCTSAEIGDYPEKPAIIGDPGFDIDWLF